MNYCIYKSVNGGIPRIVHKFNLKEAAKKKLHDMFERVACRPAQYRNLKAANNHDFSYEYQLTTEKLVKARFFIDETH